MKLKKKYFFVEEPDVQIFSVPGRTSSLTPVTKFSIMCNKGTPSLQASPTFPKFVQAITGNDSMIESGRIYYHNHPVPRSSQRVPHLLLCHTCFSRKHIARSLAAHIFRSWTVIRTQRKSRC